MIGTLPDTEFLRSQGEAFQQVITGLGLEYFIEELKCHHDDVQSIFSQME